MAMPAPPRQVSIAKPTSASRQSGVLPIPGSATTNRNSTQKGREARLKVVVRRLAPGLTEQEFWTALGEEWKVGQGKVDWFSYQMGKIAKDAAKPSRPSRAYLHLTNPQHLGPLAERIRATQFTDAKGSSSDSVLLGPPTLIFTPYNKIPGKARVDGRQGTIDQDPEFIDFLASLTNPVVKPPNIDSIIDKDTKSAGTKIITPLVQFIKDKKANKGKDGKLQKHGRQDTKDIKVEDKKTATKGAKGKAGTVDKKASVLNKAEKVKPDPPAKIAKKPPVSNGGQGSPATPVQPVPAPATSQPKPERRRERGNASMAAKIIQRDLAIANGASGRRKRDAPAATSNSTAQKPTVPDATQTQTPAPAKPVSTPAGVNPPVQPPSEPAAARKAQSSESITQQTVSPPSKPVPTSTPTTSSAFLKHANPSQGVTEPLLEEAFKVFGQVTKVEIDKKKGFAYVDFAEATSLQKAIAASPIKVAQGSVVVLEKKTGAVLQNRNSRGQQGPPAPNLPVNRGGRGGGRARGGRAASNHKATNTTAASVPAPSAPVTAPT